MLTADTSTATTRPTVLIADDEPLVVRALSRLVRQAGMSFITDTTSTHVLEMAKAHQPAVIVLDVRQHVDGRDLLMQLKKDPETRGIKVMILSAVEDQFTRHVCLELGAEDYEVKPFDVCFVQKLARMAGVEGADVAVPE